MLGTTVASRRGCLAMLQIQHHVPGRVRFRIKAPVSSSGDSGSDGGTDPETLAAILRRAPGVRQVRLNPACASLVLHYDPVRTTPQGLRALALKRAAAARARGIGASGPLWPVSRWLPAAPVVRPRSGSCGLCRLQLRVARWLTRSTLRCWWQEWRRGGGSRRERATRLDPRWRALRHGPQKARRLRMQRAPLRLRAPAWLRLPKPLAGDRLHAVRIPRAA